HFANVANDTTEIAALHIGEDVVDGLDVEMARGTGGGTALGGGPVGEKGWMGVPGGNGRAQERVGRIDEMHGRLHGHEVWAAGNRIDPVVRRHLRARCKRDHDVIGDVLLGEAIFRETCAVQIQTQFRRCYVLMNVHVRRTWNFRGAVANGTGNLEVRGFIVAGNADVDRRLEAEIQDLADDVGWLEVKGEIRKLLL